MSIYGYSTTAPPLFGYSNGNLDNHRATVFGLTPYPGHAYAMSIRGGYHDASDPCDVVLATYATSSSNPSSLLGRTGDIAVSNRMTSAGTSQEVSGALQAAFTFASGVKLGLAFVADNGDFAHGQGSSAWTMYFRGNSSGDPPNPAGMTGQTETQISIWMDYEINVAPDLPSSLSPADGATVTDTTPLYEATFTDANQVLPNGLTSDYLNVYQIQVRSVSAENATTGTVVWDSGAKAASTSERTASRFSEEHGGAALSLGTRYQWRCRVQDKLGSWSSWSHADASAWSDFLVASGGVVTLDGTPTGRTLDKTPDLQGRYHHVTGSAADRVQVRLYSGSTLIKTSPEITKAVSSSALPGTLFTITAAESTFGTLASGASFGYKMRARTTTGSVWSDWSATRTFSTNAKPATPTSLTPTGGAASSSRPLLSAVTSDADGDTLTVSARIKDSAGALLFTRTMTRVGSTNTYTYQTTATDLASFATYKWDASATDGDLTSAQSSEASFIYAEGPAITITSPTEGQVLITDTPTYTWTTTDQQKYQIEVLYPNGQSAYFAGPIVSTVSSHAQSPNFLANNTDYDLFVLVENSAPLSGWSLARRFRLQYTTPAVVTGFFAAAETANFDQVPSVTRLTWDPVTTDASMFEGYVISRRNSGQPFSSAVVIMELSSKDQDTWIDTMPQSGVEQTYSIVQKVRESSLDVLTSDPAESSMTITLNGSVVSDVRDGLGLRAVFDSVKDRSEQLVQEQIEINTWDGGAPWLFEGPTYYHTIPMEAYIYATEDASVADILQAFRGAPYEPQPLVAPYGGLAGVRADGSAVVSCYRDERGRKLFGRLREPEVTDLRLQRADVSFLFAELYYVESIS